MDGKKPRNLCFKHMTANICNKQVRSAHHTTILRPTNYTTLTSCQLVHLTVFRNDTKGRFRKRAVWANVSSFRFFLEKISVQRNITSAKTQNVNAQVTETVVSLVYLESSLRAQIAKTLNYTKSVVSAIPRKSAKKCVNPLFGTITCVKKGFRALFGVLFGNGGNPTFCVSQYFCNLGSEARLQIHKVSPTLNGAYKSAAAFVLTRCYFSCDCPPDSQESTVAIFQ